MCLLYIQCVAHDKCSASMCWMHTWKRFTHEEFMNEPEIDLVCVCGCTHVAREPMQTIFPTSTVESPFNDSKKVSLATVKIKSFYQGAFSQPLASISRMHMSTTMGLWALCAFTRVVRSQQYTFLILLRSGWQSLGTCLEHCLWTFSPQSVNKEATLACPALWSKPSTNDTLPKINGENSQGFAVSPWSVHPTQRWSSPSNGCEAWMYSGNSDIIHFFSWRFLCCWTNLTGIELVISQMVCMFLSLSGLGPLWPHAGFWVWSLRASPGSQRARRPFAQSFLLSPRCSSWGRQDYSLWEPLPGEAPTVSTLFLLVGSGQALFLPLALFWHLRGEMMPHWTPVGVPEGLQCRTRPWNVMMKVIIYKAHIKIQSWKGAFKFTEHIVSIAKPREQLGSTDGISQTIIEPSVHAGK